MSFQVRISAKAREALARLHRFQVARDLATGRRALIAISQAFSLLADAPFVYRRALPSNMLLWEIIIPFGSSGYVALYEIDGETVTVLAMRHKLEDDYY